MPDSALTAWIDIASVVNADTFTAKSNNSLVQVILNQLTVLPTDKIWAAFSVPMGCSLAEANGINYNNESVISSGSYKGWNLANNLWFKIFNNYSKTRTNLVQNSIQQFRVSALTHSNLSSHATNLVQHC